jgi:hypothetical protein
MKPTTKRLAIPAAIIVAAIAVPGNLLFTCGAIALLTACLALRLHEHLLLALAAGCLVAAIPAGVSQSAGGAADRLTLVFLVLMSSAAVSLIRQLRAEDNGVQVELDAETKR